AIVLDWLDWACWLCGCVMPVACPIQVRQRTARGKEIHPASVLQGSRNYERTGARSQRRKHAPILLQKACAPKPADPGRSLVRRVANHPDVPEDHVAEEYCAQSFAREIPP